MRASSDLALHGRGAIVFAHPVWCPQEQITEFKETFDLFDEDSDQRPGGRVRRVGTPGSAAAKAVPRAEGRTRGLRSRVGACDLATRIV